jgi:MoxR-like ATPase
VNEPSKLGSGSSLRGTSLGTVSDVEQALVGQGYLPDRGLATAVYLAGALEQPLLLEGEAGVGKTEVARALAAAVGARLIRLQCHEGIDLHHAVYDWDYQRQLLAIRAAEAGADARELFGREFLLRRPLLEALEAEEDVVLLIDEVDRADDEFEAFLLEFLADFAVTIPELGTVVARQRPLVVLTSNRTREVHDALKRRCLYHWVGHPSPEREAAILRLRLPGVTERLALQIAAATARMRALDLVKPPGVAEAIDWAAAVGALGADTLSAEITAVTLGAVLKVRDDLDRVGALPPGQLVEALDAS